MSVVSLRRGAIANQRLWLYRDGDECIDVTGGWGWKSFAKIDYMNPNPLEKANDHIKCYGVTDINTIISTLNKIKISDKNKININCNIKNTYIKHDAFDINFYEKTDGAKLARYGSGCILGFQTRSFDISDINSDCYIVIQVCGTSQYKSDIFKIWLE